MKKTAQLIFVLVLLLTSFSLLRSVVASYQKMGSLNSTQKQINALRDEKERLKAEKEYRQTPFYIEKTARDSLGLGKNGETVLVLTQPATSSALTKSKIPQSNLEAWFDLFFN
ncbi:MAG: septum formation initiator family protein [bacterium]|nr:septum formation initiator family protein [bacterium]